MLFTNISQFIVLVLMLVIGLAFGWALHPGGKKWRRRYDEIVETSNAYRAEIAGHLRESESRAEALGRDNQSLQRDLDVARARATALEVKPASVVAPLAAIPAVEAASETDAAATEAAPAAVPVNPVPETSDAETPEAEEVEARGFVGAAPAAVPAELPPFMRMSNPPQNEPVREAATDTETAEQHSEERAPAEPLVTAEPKAIEPEAIEEAPIAAETPEEKTAADAAPAVDAPAAAGFVPIAPTAGEAEPTAEATDGEVAPAPVAHEETPVAEEVEEPRKYWFGWNRPGETKSAPDVASEDELSHIRGIDGVLASRLAGLDVKHYADITTLSDEDEMALEQRLSLPAGYITREQWRDQAALLAEGKTAEHTERFGVSA